ncbi:MAG: hypothetical protein ACR2NW_09305, partial [Thermodesulfobacteriota bacterium]
MKTKMINEDIKEKINIYISGELSDIESAEVNKLIESSQEINTYYQEIKKTWGMLDNFETIEPGSDYVSKFWNKAEIETKRNKFSFFDLFNLNKKWAFAGSFGVFIIVCSFVINSYVGNNGNDIYFNNLDDESLLTNLDESINARTPDSLNIYG